MARKRYVYPTDEIAHLWMHKTQDEARNPQNNFYFNGDTIYSYGSHFPIARHVEHKGNAAVLYTTDSYGPTTGKHLNHVRMAIPGSIPVFRVPDPNRDIKRQLEYHRARFSDARGRLLEAKNKRDRVKAYKAVQVAQRDARVFAQFFGYRDRFNLLLPKSFGHTIADLDNQEREYDLQSQARSEAAQKAADTRWELQMARWEQRNAQYAAQREQERVEREQRAALLKENAEYFKQAWRDGATSITIDGKDYPVPSYLGDEGEEFPVLLRIEGDEVKTSLGARIPVTHARLGLKLVQRCRNTKTEYVRKGHTIHLGHYAIDKVDAEGNVTAGCHYVTYEEIKLLEPKLQEVNTNDN